MNAVLEPDPNEITFEGDSVWVRIADPKEYIKIKNFWTEKFRKKASDKEPLDAFSSTSDN